MKRSLQNKAFLKIAVSSLIVAVTMVGCTGGAAMMAQPGAKMNAIEKQAGASATTAEKALAKRDVALALSSAEAAVAAKPDYAAYRVLLGRAYLADGRFTSAETAFSDAMTLGNTDTRTVVSLVLAKVALGKSTDARALLVTHMDIVPAADYGLAMAMAGDPQEAIRILTAAAQEPDATIKTRQNLAYAYALAGQWREARLMAAQDLDPLAATQRIIGWAQNAEPGAEPARVAAFIGTKMRADDAGMPVRLALAPAPAPVVQMAQAEAPAAETLAASPEAPPEQAPVEIAAAPVEQPETPVIRAPEAPVRTAVVPVATPLATATTMMRKAASFEIIAPSTTTKWAVQLGAYDSAAIAKERWQHMARKNAVLSKFPVAYTTANVQGRVYHRLSLGGFADRGTADQMCRTVRSQGGACFIRAAAPTMRWAWATPKRQQLASR